MKPTIALCSALLFSALLLAPHSKADGVFTATLSGSNEVGPVASSATGSVTLTLTGDLLTLDLSFSGLTSPASAAFIHCCASAGANGPVAIAFPGFPNATSGTYNNQTFDLTLASTYVGGFLTGSGGTAADAEGVFLLALSSGLAYVNIHDAVFPGGEIRGQLVPSQTTTTAPEPGDLILLGIGLCFVAGLQRLRRFRTLTLA